MFSAVIEGGRSERDGKKAEGKAQRRAVSPQPLDSCPYLGIMPCICLIGILSPRPCTVTVWVLGQARIRCCCL